MAQTSVVTLTAPTAAVSNGICLAQTITLTATINGSLASGGIATLDMARRVYLQSGGNDAAKTLTVFGTDRYGNSITESLLGGNATTVNTQRDFKTVTTISISSQSAGTLTVGTGAVVSSAWIPVNRLSRVYNVGLAADNVTGKVTIERAIGAYDDALYLASTGSAMPPTNVESVANMTTLTASNSAGDTFPGWAYRMTTVTLNTSTATLTVTQGEV